MNHPLLSIIVPVYNVEPYIKECLDSVFAQTFQDFEIILVDDGSTDNSGTICDTYANSNEQVKVIHKKNGGVSSARNTALDVCRGKYLTMLDPDDSVAPDTYENVYYMEEHPEMDILQFPYVNCYTNGKQEKLLLKSRTIKGKDQILLNWWEGNILHFANLNKIFKKTIFQDLRYRVGHVSEDTYLVADFIEKSEQIFISEKGQYFYRIREGSLTSHYTFSKHIDLFEAHLRTYKKIAECPLVQPIRVKAFTRLFRRLISAKMESKQANIQPYLDELKRYVPTWTDISANKDSSLTLWIILVKLLGVSSFVKTFCWYLSKK